MRIPDHAVATWGANTPIVQNLEEVGRGHRKPGVADGDDWFLQTDGFGNISRVPRYTTSSRSPTMKEKPDLAERIVTSLDALLGLEGQTAGVEEHKALLGTMASIIRKEHDLAERIVDALETKFDLYSVSRRDLREMVDVVREEIINFLFGKQPNAKS